MVNKYTYLALFAYEPHKQFSLQELEEYHHIPHQTIRRQLDVLVQEKILIENKRKKFRFYQLNIDNPLTLDALSIYEKERLKERLEEDSLLNKLYEELSTHFDKCSFLIFGSSTKEKKYEDIDIICFGKDKTLLKKVELFEFTFGKEIELLETSPRNITEILYKELIKKHLIFNNHDYFVKYLFKKN